ncbi:uncharacterized protein LOC120931504 isoform X1 [Rana temporaria]|uniref:uncharacterized protein LOC120931504 isoform X1 n=1 Tax=Rana temporaria TaxID=8407 RepID=UPI001AAD0351|nr:uncharacterized protein LOC120931504 isoform X1 [Rana temporaria]
MSRKRRKNKNRKGSDSDDYEQFSFVCRCQRKSSDQKTDMVPKDGKLDQLNDYSFSCTSPNNIHPQIYEGNNQDVQHNSEYSKTASSPSEKPLDKSENFVKVILEDNSTVLQSERNEFHCDPEEQADTEGGEFTAQVTSNGVHLNVEINKILAPNSRTHVVITNGKCLKKSRSYHDRQHQQSQHHADHIWDFVSDYEKDANDSLPTEHTCDKPLIKLEIIGEGIEVSYKAVRQSLMVHIESDKVKKKTEDVFGSGFTQTTDYRSTIGSCSSYPVSDFSVNERKGFCTNYRCPEWCVHVPPPAEFADEEEVFPNTNTEDDALLLKNVIKEPYSPVSSSCSELETEPRQLKDKVCGGESIAKPGEDHPLQYLGNWKKYSKEPVGPNKTNFSRVPFVSNKELKLNPSNFCQWRMSNYHLETKVMRRRTLPEMYYDPFVNFSHLRYPFYDTEKHSALRMPQSVEHERLQHISKEELVKSAMPLLFKDCVDGHEDQIPFENKTIYFVQGDVNSSQSDIPDKTENSERCSLYSFQHVDVDNKQVDEEDLEDLIKNANEHLELTESGFDEDMLDSDNLMEVHDLSDLQTKNVLIEVTPPSRSTSRDYILGKNSGSRIPAECLPLLDQQAKELNQSPDMESTTKKRRGSVITVVTGDLDQRVLIQGDNDATTCRVQKEPLKDFKYSMVHGDSVLTPVSDVEEPDGEYKIHSSFEDQTPLACKNISSQTSETFEAFLLMENQTNVPEDTYVKEIDGNLCPEPEESNNTSPRNSSDSAIPGTSFESITCHIPCLPKSDSEDNNAKTEEKADEPLEKNEISTLKMIKRDSKSDTFSKHLKLPKDSVIKESRSCESPQEEASDRWAKKRRQFKETRNYNSAGGSSITSNITEESGNSEETRSVDLASRTDSKDKGLYTESFHSASWIFRGDDCSPDNSPRCLSKRSRSVAIRERTVRITKGTGDYPWGFRIQFSKPILVTEVDTNGAAEEAGLQVGDIVMAVNGTDVTSIPHSEAACLARQDKSCSYRTVLAVLTKRVSPLYGPKIGNIHQFFTFDINHGPDVLTLVVGSDISRFPNTPRPTCRGYLHKRTHSGLLKGWRKRWFVLKHDGTLHYYKHKKDEGKCRPLEVTKLEGSEIGVDTTLGKPFVFRCVPQSGNRIFYFCATSNQEMKRWLEAMDKAIHPLNQNHMWVDVTMHNISLPPLAIKNPECLGLLHQLDRNKDVWVQHYCILKDGCLYFYASIRSNSALGGIYLQGYTVYEQTHNSRHCIIELRPPSEEFKTFYLSAGSAAENKRWITALKTSINKWLPLHQAIQDFMSRPLEETRM